MALTTVCSAVALTFDPKCMQLFEYMLIVLPHVVSFAAGMDLPRPIAVSQTHFETWQSRIMLNAHLMHFDKNGRPGGIFYT